MMKGAVGLTTLIHTLIFPKSCLWNIQGLLLLPAIPALYDESKEGGLEIGPLNCTLLNEWHFFKEFKTVLLGILITLK